MSLSLSVWLFLKGDFVVEYNEFLAKCNELTEVSKDPSDWKQKNYSDKRDCIAVKWIVGGEARNWQGDKWDLNVESEPVDFLPLEEILAEFWPHITFLQYQKLCRKLIKYGRETDNDWYCETEYGIKYILLTELYDYLKNLQESDYAIDF